MAELSRLVFAVTSEVVYDQRMQRICSSLAHAGYDVCLVGRKKEEAQLILKIKQLSFAKHTPQPALFVSALGQVG